MAPKKTPYETNGLHTLSPQELGRLFPIFLSDSDPEWPNLFFREKERLLTLLGRETARKIEHVGSTSVPGLPAKPTIDVIVDIPSGKGIRERIIIHMEANGYIHMHEQKNHLMVVRGYTPEGMIIPSYHIHMGNLYQDELREMIIFRDILRSDGRTARAYANLKKKLALLYRNDREAYTGAKTDFIQQVLKR